MLNKRISPISNNDFININLIVINYHKPKHSPIPYIASQTTKIVNTRLNISLIAAQAVAELTAPNSKFLIMPLISETLQYQQLSQAYNQHQYHHDTNSNEYFLLIR